MVYYNFLHLLHVFLWKIIIRLIKGDTNNVGKSKDSPGLGLRALHAMSSASITIMWLCEYDSKKTVIIVKWKLIYTNHQRQFSDISTRCMKKLSCYN